MRLLRTKGRGAAETRRILEQLERRRESSADSVAPIVRHIVNAVRKGGDKAVRKYAAQLDGLSPQSPLQITLEEMQQAWKQTAQPIQEALRVAAGNIRGF